MLAKAAVAVLVAAFVLGGVTVCPRGGLSCPTRNQAQHRCCTQAESLQATTCCVGATHAPSAAISPPDANPERGASAHLLAAVAVATAVRGGDWQNRTRHYRFLRAGPAPPHTPLAQRTSLLL